MFKNLLRAFRCVLASFLIVMGMCAIGQAQTFNRGVYGPIQWDEFSSAAQDSVEAARLQHKDTELGAWFYGLPFRMSAGNNLTLTATDHTDSVTYDYKLSSTATWTVLYFDGSNDPVELALGADGTFLQSNGAAAAPTFEAAGGTGDMLKSVYDVDTDGDIDLAAGGLAANVSAYTGLVAISGSAASEVDSKSELEAQLADVEGLCETGDIMTLTANWVNTDFPWADDEVANNITVDEASDVDTSGTKIAAALAFRDAYSDSAGALTWRKKEYRMYNVFVSEKTDDDITVKHPTQSGNFAHVYKVLNYGVTADAACTLTYVMKLPGDGVTDLDSARIDAFTSTDATTDASMEIKVYKRTAPGTAATLVATVAAFATTGAFEHKLISSFSPAVAQNNEVELQLAITCDPGDSVMFNFADVHWTGQP